MIFNLYLTFSLTIINSLALFFVVYRYLHILQLYNYKNKEFAYNFFKQGQYKLVLNYIFVVLLFLSVGHTLNYFFVSNDISSYWLFIIFTCYLIFALVTFLMYIMKKYKKPLKFTNRVKRIIFCYVLITLILSFIVVYFVNKGQY